MNNELVNSEIARLCALADEKYGIEMPVLSITYDVRGMICAKAWRKNFLGDLYYGIDINAEMLNDCNFAELMATVLPHEVAHIVCYVMNSDYGHGSAWRKVCIELGGNGSRVTRGVTVSAGKKRYRYAYTSTCGHRYELSDVKHNRIQRGIKYTTKHGGLVDRDCRYEKIG